MPRDIVPDRVLRKVPPLMMHDGEHPDDVPVAFKVFAPGTNYTFYVTEGSAMARRPGGGLHDYVEISLDAYLDMKDELELLDIRFFGLAVLHEVELGYASYDEWRHLRIGPIYIELDRHMPGEYKLGDAMRHHDYPVRERRAS